MAEASLEAALDLLADGQVEDARDVILALLAEGPEEEPGLRALHALVLLALDRRDEAAAEAADARMMAPGHPFIEYVRGEVALARGEVREALDAAAFARREAPDYRDARLLEARARVRLGQWHDAERVAREVAEEDPEDDEAATLAAMAAAAGSRGRLDAGEWAALSARFPVNAVARAGEGWATLERGGAREARVAFEQALALDPRLDWAREGLVLALKARNPLYAALLRYFLWVGRLSSRTQNLLTFGGLIGFNVLRGVAKASPELGPWLTPLLVAYALFVFSSWLADPLLNAMLWLRPETRPLLDDDQRRSGLLVAGALLTGCLLGAVAALTPWHGLLLPAIAIGSSSLAIAATFRLQEGPHRRRLGWLALVAVACGVLAIAADGFFFASLLASIAATWMSRFAPDHEQA